MPRETAFLRGNSHLEQIQQILQACFWKQTSYLAYSNVPSNQRTIVLANGNASRPDVSFVSPFWNALAPVYAIIYGFYGT